MTVIQEPKWSHRKSPQLVVAVGACSTSHPVTLFLSLYLPSLSPSFASSSVTLCNRYPTDTDQTKITVAIALVVAITTLILHVALCWVTRQWAYHAVERNSPHYMLHKLSVTKKKRLRKKRPKFHRVPLESSTDCSL